MAWHGADGKGGSKQFTNRDAAKGFERRSGGSVASAVASPQKGEFGQEGGDWGEEQEEDPHAVAQAHGPAHTVNIDHQMGHHVHSEHPDGHVTETDHESIEAAHEHGKGLAGCGGDGMERGSGGGATS